MRKKKSSKNKYIIGFTIGLGGPLILGLIFLSIMLYSRRNKRVEKSEEEINDDVEFSEEESKKEEQENPLYEIHLSHDPFEEKSIEE